ncbi:MAG: hypothetical protein IPJ33_09770 [Gammaproteobacteria bacterium]|jgi:hypothetical protein|nr:hypothetical protein [Gammaproteobacteria bacterium]MBP6050710.1 hypothetical protein [Pseudomonadales bacterium]MBK7168826.1 hypothetical protein [Gammaproteobacteria bacterium]MBK7520980.1 hypothetical protein [Gammaproteobacteria bacterium]MBK7728756.1 hypothetical protein [Gammaproteobacteria bacterium]
MSDPPALGVIHQESAWCVHTARAGQREQQAAERSARSERLLHRVACHADWLRTLIKINMSVTGNI